MNSVNLDHTLSLIPTVSPFTNCQRDRLGQFDATFSVPKIGEPPILLWGENNLKMERTSGIQLIGSSLENIDQISCCPRGIDHRLNAAQKKPQNGSPPCQVFGIVLKIVA
jgi:hypothetical protein